MWQFILIFLCVLGHSSVLCVDWCDIQDLYCKSSSNTLEHIGCVKNKTLNDDDKIQNCKGIKPIELSDNLMNHIMELHNLRRLEIATGELGSFPPACRMNEIVWCSQLQELAELHVQKCSDKHDECRATPFFHNPGQNIGIYPLTFYSANSTREIITDIINKWWTNGIKTVSAETVRNFPTNQDSLTTNFANMINENNTAIGCGLLKMERRYIFTCNYAQSPMTGKELYKIGEPCTECRIGCDAKFMSLCLSMDKDKVTRKILNWDERPDLKNVILKQHNLKRMTIATGKLRNFKSASRMSELVWDKQLQNNAQEYIVNLNRITNIKKDTTLNLYQMSSIETKIKMHSKLYESIILESIINKWWDDGMNNILPEMVQLYDFGDEANTRFANMINENNTRIGCGFLQFSTAKAVNDINFVFACSYEHPVELFKSLYKSGEPCIDCLTGCSLKYGYLCKVETV